MAFAGFTGDVHLDRLRIGQADPRNFAQPANCCNYVPATDKFCDLALHARLHNGWTTPERATLFTAIPAHASEYSRPAVESGRSGARFIRQPEQFPQRHVRSA